jgi:DNA polymerase-3 subunit delta
MIIYIFGEDTFRSRQYLREQITKFKQARDPQGYNVSILDAKKETPGKIMSEILASPFLAEKRMVVLENILSQSDKEFLSTLITRIKEEKFPESNIIVCWQGEPLSKVKEAKELHELLQHQKYAQEFYFLKGKQLTGWIEQEIKKRGALIEPSAMDFLVSFTGEEMWHLNSLIDQLVAYAHARTIVLSDVSLFITEKMDDNIFNLVDALVSGDHKKAFNLLAYQRQIGAEDGQIIGLIVWQLRILIQLRDLLDREENSTSDSAAKKIGIHPFVAKKNWSLVKRYSLQKLQTLYRLLLDMDIKTKTGVASQELLLDMFAAKV